MFIPEVVRLATLGSASIQSSLFSSSDSFLAVRVGSCVVINAYLPTSYKNDESEQLFAQTCEKLHAFITQGQKLNFPGTLGFLN